jgi:hypothetical protein
MRLSLLVAALFGLAALGPARDPIPEPSLKAATEADIAYLNKALEVEPKKNAVSTIKATAMLVALAAQKSGNGALQDQALAVAAAYAGKEKNHAAAKAAAAKLAAANGGSVKTVALHEQHKFNLGEVMSVYRPEKSGGLNMEKDIRAQSKKVTDVKLAEVLGARNALVAEYTAKMPEGADTDAKKKQWADWSKESADLGAAIAAEAGKGAKANKTEVEKKLKALDANCTACHNVFRN